MLNGIVALHSAGTPASTNSYESIASASGSGSSGSITFNSIPSTYKHLQVRAIGRSDYAADNVQIAMRFNGDTTALYSTHILSGIGSNPATASGTANTTYVEAGQAVAANGTASAMGVTIIDILDYADTNKYKTSRTLSGFDLNGSGQVLLESGSWRNTAAITSITLIAGAGNWTTATRFALYGIKG